MKDKLPKIINIEDKETLGVSPDTSPQEGLRVLKRAATSGVFTLAPTESYVHRRKVSGKRK